MTTLSLLATSASFRASKTIQRSVAADLAAHARRPDTRRRIIEAVEQLDNDDCDSGRVKRLRQCLDELCPHTDFLDNAVLAHAAADVMRPARVLEIGVRRGFTSAAIGAAAPQCELHLMDYWRPIYAGRANPGPNLVRKQLEAIGHVGEVFVHFGSSHDLLPKLFDDNASGFDLVIVDGDHTEDGAQQDLQDVFPHVAAGGVLIFDDLVHPGHPYLLRVWQSWRDKLAGEFTFNEYLSDGLGVGWAIRK